MADADERREHDDEGCCPSCGTVMREHEIERGAVVCDLCDERLEKLLAAWLDFAAIRDG